ncbi:hypothetical protein GCM10023188_43720 [Pontibacter saemangeumensis]|uniref:YD repeat-containing protein n=1 Tax=Pontibacter saemangeumensis TaxID=1084525 RepID=A0ABP8M4M0_9BACT
MKTFPTVKTRRLLLILSVLLASCHDDEIDFPQPSECKLTEVSFYENGVSDGSATKVEYDSQGYVTKVTEVEGMPSELVEASTFSYNASHQLVREDYIWDSGRIEGYKTHTYNPDGALAQTVDHRDGSGLRTETYTYDTNGRVTEIAEAGDGSSSKRTFAYIGNSENISRVTHHDGNGQVVGTTTYEDYDNNLNVIYAAKGMLTVGVSRNNPGKETSVHVSQQDEITHYTYQYNSSGFVTEMEETREGEAGAHQSVYTYSGCD